MCEGSGWVFAGLSLSERLPLKIDAMRRMAVVEESNEKKEGARAERKSVVHGLNGAAAHWAELKSA